MSDDRTGRSYNTNERRKSLGNKSGIEMDVNGSITWKPETEQSSQMNNVGLASQNISRAESPGNVPEASKTAMFPLIQFAKLIKRGSYVGTLIIMMVILIHFYTYAYISIHELGMEHNIPQLVIVSFSVMVLCNLDDS